MFSEAIIYFVLNTLTAIAVWLLYAIYDETQKPPSREADVIWQRVIQCAAIGALITLIQYHP